LWDFGRHQLAEVTIPKDLPCIIDEGKLEFDLSIHWRTVDAKLPHVAQQRTDPVGCRGIVSRKHQERRDEVASKPEPARKSAAC
jgi:hypothetical protein